MATKVASRYGQDSDHALLDAGEEEEEQLLEAVAAEFVSLVHRQVHSQVSEKSPAPPTLLGTSDGVKSDGASPNSAKQIAHKLKYIGDGLDAKVHKEIREATAGLLHNTSVFQVGMEQFTGLCNTVLSRCSGVLTSGWQQVAAVYLTQSQMSTQLETERPSHNSEVETGRQNLFNRYIRQYMLDVGLNDWMRQHGGVQRVPDHVQEQELDVVPIPDQAEP